jgi:predicted dehydrogenase
MQSLSHGFHTITEKPVALHKADAEAMFALADRQGRQLYVAQVLQFTREVQVLRELVRSGTYGRPLDAHFERLSACPRWAQDGWLFDREKSGLLPFDLHIHDLDVIVSLFGRPRSFSYTASGRSGLSYKEQYRFQYAYDGLNLAADAALVQRRHPLNTALGGLFENAS